MTTTLKSSEPKARKDHQCWWCGETIPKGEQYATWTNCNSDGIATTKCHLECRAAWYTLDDWGYDYVDFAEFCRGCTCERDNCKCQ